MAATIAFIALVYHALARGIRASREPSSVALAALPGLAMGLVAVTLHSATDFGQHVPAVAFLTAISSALIVVLSMRRRDVTHERRGVSARLGLGCLTLSVVASVVTLAPRPWPR